MKKLLFLLPLILLADVDPFKAGDLNSPNPYGLTPQEIAIYKNKSNIKKNSYMIKHIEGNLKNFQSEIAQKFVAYDQSISDLNNKFSSFNTILSEIDTLKNSIDNIKRTLKDTNLSNMKNRIKTLEQKVELIQQQQNAMKKSFQEFTKISNENFQNLQNSMQTILEQLKKMNSPKISLSPKQAFKKAQAYYFGNRLNKAKELFLYSLEKKYMPATSSYYLGEIAYSQGKYKEALGFYKKSVMYYPKKTSFTTRLLYHTGIAFKKIGQTKKAKLTFQKLIHDFPKSKYTNLAKKELAKLH
jgi:TolA-binding protein